MNHLETTYGNDQEAWATLADDIPVIVCSECGKPAAIYHDIDLSVCCLAQIKLVAIPS